MKKNSPYILKYGQQGDLVFILQGLLGIKQDGIFGNDTKKALISFQGQHGLVKDHIVGPMTWDKLNFNPLELNADTDALTSATWIEQYNLPENEYVKEATSKKVIVLHHTSGFSDPYKVIDTWANDQRGRVGSNYVIGGLPCGADVNNLSLKQTKHDGKILQAVADRFWAYHLGKVRSAKLHKTTLSIELCSAGALKQKDGKYYTWYDAEVHESQVCRLNTPYKGQRYFHKYSQAQLESLKALLLLLSEKHDIDLTKGLIDELVNIRKNDSAFDYNQTTVNQEGGIITHGQVREDKMDLFPQPELIEMLKTLH